MIGQIDLRRPIRSERVRDFQPPWRTVFIYKCPECGNEVRVRANSFRGKTAVPSVGAITCPQCEFLEKYPKEKPNEPGTKPPQQQHAGVSD